MLLSICYVPAACYSHDYSADTFLWTSFDQTFGASIDASHRRMLRSIAQARCRCIAKTFATAQALRLIGLRRHWHAPGKKKQQRWSRSSGDCHAYKPAPSSTLPGCASSPVQMRRSNGRKQKQAHRYTLGLYCGQGFHASSWNPNGAYVKSARCYRTCYDSTMLRRVETFKLPKQHLPTVMLCQHLNCANT